MNRTIREKSKVQTDFMANPAVVLGMFETGLGVGRSLGRVGVRVLGLDYSKKIGFYSRYIKASLCPHPIEHEEEFIDFLIRFGENEKLRPILFITSDEFILPVSRRRNELEQYYLLNLPDQKIIECIVDKYKQYELALSAGIPVPKSFLIKNMDQLHNIIDRIPFPAFIKGVDVMAWRKKFGIALKGFRVYDQNELLDTCNMVFEQGVSVLVQELIEGPDTCIYSASFYLSRKSEVLSAFGFKKIRQQPVNYGFGCFVQSVEHPELMELGKAFFTKIIGYRGVGEVEFKLDQRDNKLKYIEMNPRYWQQNALAEKCGMNFPLINYLELTDQDPKASFVYRQGIKWVNICSDFESFREYRRREELSVISWFLSLRGEKVFSDLASDDIIPGFHEIIFQNILRRSKRYAMKIFK